MKIKKLLLFIVLSYGAAINGSYVYRSLHQPQQQVTLIGPQLRYDCNVISLQEKAIIKQVVDNCILPMIKQFQLDLSLYPKTSVCLYGCGQSLYNAFSINILNDTGCCYVTQQFRPLHIFYNFPLLNKEDINFFEKKDIQPLLSSVNCISVILQELCNKKAVLFCNDNFDLKTDPAVQDNVQYIPFAVITDRIVSKIKHTDNKTPIFFTINGITKPFIIIKTCEALPMHYRPEFTGSFDRLEWHDLENFDLNIFDIDKNESRKMSLEERQNSCGTIILGNELEAAWTLYKDLFASRVTPPQETEKTGNVELLSQLIATKQAQKIRKLRDKNTALLEQKVLQLEQQKRWEQELKRRDSNLKDLEAEYKKNLRKLEEMTRKIEENKKQIEEITLQKEKIIGEKKRLQDSSISLEKREERTYQRLQTTQEAKESLERANDTQQKEIGQLKEEIKHKAEEIQERVNKYEILERSYNSMHKQQENIKSERQKLEQKNAALSQDLKDKEEKFSQNQNEWERIKRELNEIIGQLEEEQAALKKEQDDLKEQNEKLKVGVEKNWNLYNQALDRHTQERSEWEKAKNELDAEKTRFNELYQAERGSLAASTCTIEEKEAMILEQRAMILEQKKLIDAIDPQIDKSDKSANERIESDLQEKKIQSLEAQIDQLKEYGNNIDKIQITLKRYKGIATIGGIGFLMLILLYIRDKCSHEKFLFA